MVRNEELQAALPASTGPLPAVHLDRLVRIYGPYSRSLRIFRGLAGNGLLLFFMSPVLMLVIVLLVDPVPGFALIAFALALAYMAFGIYAIHVYECIARSSLFAIRGTIWLITLFALGRVVLSLSRVLAAGGTAQIVVPVIFGLLLYVTVSGLLVGGLWPLALHSSAAERELLAVRTRERARFFRPIGALVRDVGRMAGLVIPPGQRRIGWFPLVAAITAFVLEGSVYYVYLQAGWNIAKRGKQWTESAVPAALPAVLVLVMPLLTLAVGRLFFALARRLRTAALRRSLKTAQELQQQDIRAPVVILRSFRDDQVNLSAARLPFASRFFDSGAEARTLETIIMRNMTAVGPVIATGNPTDPAPPIGAARAYLKDEEWQTRVGDALSNASVIVLSLDDTPGVRWELRQLATQRLLQKTLIIVPPRLTRLPEAHIDLLAEAGVRSVPAPQDDTQAYIIAYLFNDDGLLFPLTSSHMSELEYEVAVRLAIHWIPRNSAALPNEFSALMPAAA